MIFLEVTLDCMAVRNKGNEDNKFPLVFRGKMQAQGSKTQHVVLGRSRFIFPNVDMQY